MTSVKVPYVFRKQSFEYFTLDYFISFKIELPANYGEPLKISLISADSIIEFQWLIISLIIMNHSITDALEVLEQSLELEQSIWGGLLSKTNQIKYPAEFRVTYPAMFNTMVTSVRFVSEI